MQPFPGQINVCMRIELSLSKWVSLKGQNMQVWDGLKEFIPSIIAGTSLVIANAEEVIHMAMEEHERTAQSTESPGRPRRRARVGPTRMFQRQSSRLGAFGNCSLTCSQTTS